MPSRVPSHRSVAGLAALAAILMTSTSALAAPLTNGDFQAPSHPGYTLVNTGGSIAGWTVTDGSVDHGTAPAQTTCQSAGGQCVDLNGNGPGTISQAFDTSCKPMFRVSFFLSRHMVLGATPATMIALVDGVQVKSFSHSAAGVTATDGKWQAEGFDFTANGPTSTLAFRSTTKTANIAAGPQIDNVTIKPLGCR